MIPKPINSYRAKNGAIGLVFDEKECPNKINDGLYFVRGSICWPIQDPITAKSRGYALVAGQRLTSKTIIVFECTPFTHIANVLEDNVLTQAGLVNWLRAVYQKYWCDSFFWSGNRGTHMKYHLDVVRCKELVPQPWLIEAHIPREEDSINLLFNLKSKDQLIVDDESELVKALELWDQNGRKDEIAAVKSLLTLVWGYGLYPFMPKQTEEED
jgi:hypothetical protein